METVERWSIWQKTFQGKSDGNPYVDCSIYGKFYSQQECKTVSGFYDGNGTYVVRFMPSFTGCYRYEICGDFGGKSFEGAFQVVEAAGENHGPVHADGLHFFYEDGLPYLCMGTTAYAWLHQPENVQEQTLCTLKASPFNKLRFCIFPKSYDYNFADPIFFPYPGKACDNSGMNELTFQNYKADMPGNSWDFMRFEPAFFRNIERGIERLLQLGIQADIILFHPYDRWGFSLQEKVQNERYLRYCIARFAGYRNVWWSLANEYDLCESKQLGDWEDYAKILVDEDPYGRLRSIHNCWSLYDFSRPWVTHASVQRQPKNLDLAYISDWRRIYKKPVLIDEMGYEGNFQYDWGNLTAQELVSRFWLVFIQGGYATHGECVDCEDTELVWWSHGGWLLGQSAQRLAFLKKIWEDTPDQCGLRLGNEKMCGVLDKYGIEENAYRLYYFGHGMPANKTLHLGTESYKVDLIDTWEMTIELIGIFSGSIKVTLPGKPWMALRVVKQI